jgi:hypothetical protein
MKGKELQELQNGTLRALVCDSSILEILIRQIRFLSKSDSGAANEAGFARSPSVTPELLQLLLHPPDFSLAHPLLPAIFRSPSKTLSSSGLGHRPFTAVTRVRIPLGSPSALRRVNLLQQRTYIPS